MPREEEALLGPRVLHTGLCCHRVAVLLYDMLRILLASLQKGQNWAGLMTGGCFGEGGALEAAGVLGVRVFVSRGVEP